MIAKPITLAARDMSAAWAGNTHRVYVQRETEHAWYAWPDPTDQHCSPYWKPFHPGQQPLEYPKIAWRKVG